MLWPKECLFDLWPVRACFAQYYNHTPTFFFAEENGQAAGLLALSWIEEERFYGHFPGETWQGKTWLEQNRIPASRPSITVALLNHCPGPMHLRYLTRESLPITKTDAVVDETGYLFFPAQYDYNFENYWAAFSKKSRKQLGGELEHLEAMGISYRFNDLSDCEKLLQMNRQTFGERSYFHDPRFLKAFEALAAWLASKGMLRLTTILIGGRIAAGDMGGIYNSGYTILAGGTNPEFPGIAKLINFQHIRWACRERLKVVDFLCGDFGWKERLHLTPRPLFKWDTLAGPYLEAKSNVPISPAAQA